MRKQFGAVVAVAALVSCGGSWRIVKQATPSPFKADSTFAVAPATWEGVMVGKKTEADWLSDKKPETQASHTNDKASLGAQLSVMAQTHAKALKIVQGEANYTVKPNVFWFEPGYYAMVASAPTQIKVRFDIVDGQGATVDQIEIEGVGAATMAFNPIPRATVGQRLSAAADQVAERCLPPCTGTGQRLLERVIKGRISAS